MIILASETITITGAWDDDNAKRAAERNKGVIFKNCAPVYWQRKWNISLIK